MAKKALFITLLTIFLLIGIAQAVDDLPDPGMLPDHPLYFLKRWGENIRTFFTFGDVPKAERYLFLAERRITEARALAEKGKPEPAERALEQHRNQLNRALGKAEEAKKKGLDTDAVLVKISQATLRHQAVLAEIYGKVPEEARPAIERAMEQSMQGHEQAFRAITEQKREQIGEEIETTRQEVFKKAEQERRKSPGIPVEFPGVACPMIYDPVCGIDGITYSNSCVAEMIHGIEVSYGGECGFPSDEPFPPIETLPVEPPTELFK